MSSQPVGRRPADRRPLPGHTDAVNTVAFSPDGRQVVSGGADDNVRFWQTGTGQPIGPALTGHSTAVEAVVFNPDSRSVVSANADGTVQMIRREFGGRFSGRCGDVGVKIRRCVR